MNKEQDENQKKKTYRSFREKVDEGWEEFRNHAAFWVNDIISNRKKLFPIVIVFIIGIIAFIRGLIKALF